jgi:outer membrane protein OmpA-like peptidoglycan-associated protein
LCARIGTKTKNRQNSGIDRLPNRAVFFITIVAQHACMLAHGQIKGKSMLSKITAAAAAVSFIALAGCAQTDGITDHGSTQNGQETAAVTSAKPGDPANARGADADSLQSATENPALVEFDPQSVELNSQAKTLVVKLAAPTKRANKILVTGYADRKTSSAAQKRALARAIAVKNELVKNGVLAKNIRIKYITDQARNAAMVEWSGEALKVVDGAARNAKN